MIGKNIQVVNSCYGRLSVYSDETRLWEGDAELFIDAIKLLRCELASESPSAIFKTEQRKIMDDMKVEHQKMYREQQRMACELSASEADNSSLRIGCKHLQEKLVASEAALKECREEDLRKRRELINALRAVGDKNAALREALAKKDKRQELLEKVFTSKQIEDKQRKLQNLVDASRRVLDTYLRGEVVADLRQAIAALDAQNKEK